MAGLFATTSVRVQRPGHSPVDYLARTIELKANVVCAVCNNGWMSSLESLTKPLLVPMINGTETVLDLEAQRTVSAWATKTTMVFEHTLSLPGRNVYWSRSEREQFRIPPHTPPGKETVVRIAAYDGVRLAYGRAGREDLVTIAGRDPGASGTRATLTVGKLVLQVEADRWEEATGRTGWRWPPPFNNSSEWIWPSQHAEVHWPPSPALNNAALEAFATE